MDNRRDTLFYYPWPQKTCKLLNNTFAGSNWSVIVMRIEQSEVLWYSMSHLILRVFDRNEFVIFWGVQKLFQDK